MKNDNEPPVGGEPPLPPDHSLPSYREPTPETHRKFSRETEAELALKNTIFAPGIPVLLIAFFLGTIAAVPLVQFASELRTAHSIRHIPTFVTFTEPFSRLRLPHVHHFVDLWRLLPHADELKSAQKTLELDSVVAQWLLPRAQSILTGELSAGNEQVYLGRHDWLFYRADVDYVIGQPFLDPFWIRRRTFSAGVQPNAAEAILQFRDQLARRGIDLLVMPVPVKPSIDGEMLALDDDSNRVIENESFQQFKNQLEKQNVRTFDPAPSLMQRKTEMGGTPLYLKADTHWRPDTMEFVAQQLASSLKLSSSPPPASFEVDEKSVTALGDIARMLKLPAMLESRYEQTVRIHEITAGRSIWRPNKDADLLFLGDSFANIFSLEALGWGESAGLIEHLSAALGGRPMDCIVRNSDGAFATREILNRELARGRDRLAGKKLVIWEFAARELAFGNWKLLDLKLGHPSPSHFFVPPPGQKVFVTGTVESISPVPLPGSVPYADHIMAMHLVDLNGEPLQCLVYLWSMRDNKWTPAARLRPGDKVSMQLQTWSDVSAQLEKINRSEVDDPATQLEEPCWGELVERAALSAP